MRISDIDFPGKTAKSHREEKKIELPIPRIANRSSSSRYSAQEEVWRQLAGAARVLIIDYMAKGWIIIAHREQHDTGAPLKEWYAVAIPDRVRAVEALRLRKNLLDATLTVESEASPEYLDQLDVKDGQILSIVPL